ncbi:MAG: hypothetical protein OXU36_10635 [Candidatus Poribacteria bacterium]|nr:hypothetical protein [Candidatus Poribacteria bacterium]
MNATAKKNLTALDTETLTTVLLSVAKQESEANKEVFEVVKTELAKRAK